MTQSKARGEMTTALVLTLVLVVLIVVAVYVPRFLMKRALRSVVSLFRRYGATGPTTATTPQELGLVQPNYLDRMFKRRDYRPLAARTLAKAGIIQAIDGEKVYLSEEELERSPLKKYAAIKSADDAGGSASRPEADEPRSY